MQFRISAGAAALVGANTHASRSEASIVSVDGPFLLFSFAGSTLDECLTELRDLDGVIGQRIADANAAEVINAYGMLKTHIAGVERDLRREFIYRARSSETAEAAPESAGSQLHAEQHASITDLPQSNQADCDEDEEIDDGSTQEQDREQEQPAGEAEHFE